ncbi:MAG: sulfurtransferase, partial [Alphaproteobacteria bacterium]|nr:sulfurtransferase [Alphaproteobacteria bacterium]
SAARAWWMFRVFGHNDVAVLDGGLPKWLAEGRPVTDAPTMPVERHFTARFNNFLVRDFAQITANLAAKRETVIDARSAGRFEGTEPEIRPNTRSGHIPGARSMPYTDLLDPKSKTFLAADALDARFKAAGIDVNKPIVCSCGSGVTACVDALGLYLLGHDDVAVYDGSWSEWGGRPDTPIET